MSCCAGRLGAAQRGEAESEQGGEKNEGPHAMWDYYDYDYDDYYGPGHNDERPVNYGFLGLLIFVILLLLTIDCIPCGGQGGGHRSMGYDEYPYSGMDMAGGEYYYRREGLHRHHHHRHHRGVHHGHGGAHHGGGGHGGGGHH